MKSLRYGLLAIGLSSQLGCAHAQQTAAQEPVNQESNSMSASNDEQIHSLQKYPELTPEGMGRRFLKYLDSLHTREQINPAFLEQQMGVRLTAEPSGAYFTMRLPDSERQYAVSYYQDRATPPSKSIKLWLSTGLTREEWNMAPVCAMDVEAYRVGLEAIGYKSEGRGIYHHSSSEIPPFFYRRGQIAVSVRVAGESEQKPEHLCVTTIDVGFGG